MSLPVAYAALLTGVVVWFFLVRKLSAKSWETQVAATEVSGDAKFTAAKVGLWVFLAVVTSLFGLFISAYYMRMGEHDHGAALRDWSSFADPQILWVNTALLVLGSIAMQAARAAVARAEAQRARVGLVFGGLLTIVFLAGQFFAWRQLRLSEYFTPRNPAIAFFYLLTAVHGLHLLGGLFVWGRTLARMSKKEVELIDVRLSVELCSVYWHYLLLVWLGLFAVLLST